MTVVAAGVRGTVTATPAAGARRLSRPMAAQALTLYRLLVAQGKSELDAAAILTLYPEPAPGE